jgi:hypothetical protein
MRWKRRRICEITRRQQTLCLQCLQAQQQVIARKGRIGLVRGISVTCRPQRQQLPHLLVAILQKADELIRPSTEVADAEWTRERRGMQQDAASSITFHMKTPFLRTTLDPCRTM